MAISTAIKKGGTIFVYDEQGGTLFAKDSTYEIQGYRSSSVTLKRGNTIFMY